MTPVPVPKSLSWYEERVAELEAAMPDPDKLRQVSKWLRIADRLFTGILRDVEINVRRKGGEWRPLSDEERSGLLDFMAGSQMQDSLDAWAERIQALAPAPVPAERTDRLMGKAFADRLKELCGRGGDDLVGKLVEEARDLDHWVDRAEGAFRAVGEWAMVGLTAIRSGDFDTAEKQLLVLAYIDFTPPSEAKLRALAEWVRREHPEWLDPVERTDGGVLGPYISEAGALTEEELRATPGFPDLEGSE